MAVNRKLSAILVFFEWQAMTSDSYEHNTLGGLIRLLWVGLFVGLPRLGYANDAHNQLMATTEEHRRAAFQVVIGGAGERCDSVKRTFFQGERPNGDAIWNIECDNDSYSIIVAPDGKTKLISCSQLMRLGGTQCFRPM